MSDDSDPNHLDLFGAWLHGLGDDAEQLSALLRVEAMPEAPKQHIAGGLNYLFKMLDLIPDGVDDIGYLDDAFVLRVSAELAIQEDVGELDADGLRVLNRMANDVDAIREFLGKDFARLHDYVRGLRRGAARGRSAADIVRDPATREAFLSDVRSFCRAYEPPRFAREEKSLVKLRAFFDAKLPK
ncbi:MAG TPA: YkvA family protein [Polyangiales bacterium]|nr:YkvA family protein [Polyangiales bacterium]